MSEMADRERNKYHRRKQRPRRCPSCGSKNLENVGGEYFCAECDWDGVDLYARMCVVDDPRKYLQRSDDEEEDYGSQD
jgi:hypothetical protein